MRAAGGDRFDTAAAVADLLSDYNPVYLPINMQAIDADTLDGQHASDFLPTDGRANTSGHADTSASAAAERTFRVAGQPLPPLAEHCGVGSVRSPGRRRHGD